VRESIFLETLYSLDRDFEAGIATADALEAAIKKSEAEDSVIMTG